MPVRAGRFEERVTLPAASEIMATLQRALDANDPESLVELVSSLETGLSSSPEAIDDFMIVMAYLVRSAARSSEDLRGYARLLRKVPELDEMFGQIRGSVPAGDRGTVVASFHDKLARTETVRSAHAGSGAGASASAIGFRPTRDDVRIIDTELRAGESRSDVIRRALRALEQQSWREQAHADMQRIVDGGEDLGGEPDAW